MHVVDPFYELSGPAVTDNNILGQIALGYSPMIDRNRNVVATRLSVFPLRQDSSLDVAQLLTAVGEVWPVDGGKVSLNVLSESLLHDLLSARPSTNLMVEVPNFMAVDVQLSGAIRDVHANGNTLLLKGRPRGELPRDVLPCFKYSIIHIDEERRAPGGAVPPGVTRTIQSVQSGVRSMAELEASFQRGVTAVLGWPIDDAVCQAGRKAAQRGQQIIVDLIRGVDAGEPIDAIESTIRRDPTLEAKLVRYINSPLFDRPVETGSLSDVVATFSYSELKRWLALLLATASNEVDQRPVMFAAVRRGLLMEELARFSGGEEMGSELFVCGVFSLLDKMMGEPLGDALKSIPVPERVQQALVDASGPYQPYCELVAAVEAESLYDFREAAAKLLMSEAEINRAILRALANASQIE